MLSRYTFKLNFALLQNREIAEEVLNESQQEVAEKLARERAERAIMLHKLAESFCADVLDGGINEMCREESALYLR